MMVFVFDDDQAMQLRREYEAGATLQELGAKYFCRHPTVSRAIKRVGGKTRPHHVKTNKHLPMMLHDWNADKSSDRMAEVYGYDSAQSMRGAISHYRKRGWAFKRR